MMWFFAVLVVLALGGVAAVAAGRGRSMAPEHPDRPDVLIPAEGPVRAEDLRRVRFSLAFRGYRMDEVDSLLARLAAEKEPAEQSGVPTTNRPTTNSSTTQVSDPRKPASPSS